LWYEPLQNGPKGLEGHLHLLNPACFVRLAGRTSLDPVVKLTGKLGDVHVLDLLLPDLGT
jgi:hypothetical protein